MVFTKFGDKISISNSPVLSLKLKGPFADKVPSDDDNLVLKSARLMTSNQGMKITLDKNIPVAAGLGGGSSDAACVLRLISKMQNLPLPDAAEILKLGADVPVCLAAKPSQVGGIGEQITQIPPMLNLNLVLVNAGQSLPTSDVYSESRRLEESPMLPIPEFKSINNLVSWLNCQRNDLETAAKKLCPSVSKTLYQIGKIENCLLARMSGSGATCFGLFENALSAASAASMLKQSFPSWWVKQTTT